MLRYLRYFLRKGILPYATLLYSVMLFTYVTHLRYIMLLTLHYLRYITLFIYVTSRYLRRSRFRTAEFIRAVQAVWSSVTDLKHEGNESGAGPLGGEHAGYSGIVRLVRVSPTLHHRMRRRPDQRAALNPHYSVVFKPCATPRCISHRV